MCLTASDLRACLCVLCAGEDEDQFEQFMLPLTAAFEAVAQMLSTNTFNEQEAKVTNTQARICLFIPKADVNAFASISIVSHRECYCRSPKCFSFILWTFVWGKIVTKKFEWLKPFR